METPPSLALLAEIGCQISARTVGPFSVFINVIALAKQGYNNLGSICLSICVSVGVIPEVQQEMEIDRLMLAGCPD